MFKRKKKEEPKIEFFTDLEGALEMVPPVPMRNALPKWFKDTPMKCPMPPRPGMGPMGPPPLPGQPAPAMPDAYTIRACAGIHDILRWGYMIPMWADHEVNTFPDSMDSEKHFVKAATPELNTGNFHGFQQAKMPHAPGEYPMSPKLDSPWTIRTPVGWSVALLPLPYGDNEFTQPWRVLPGIIDTDRYHNLNVLLKWKHEGKYIIEQGTPLCVVVPFKRDTTELPATFTQVDKDEMQRLKAPGKGGTGVGQRLINLPYQRHRKEWDRMVH